MQQINRKNATLVSAFALLATVSYYELAASGPKPISSFITQQFGDGIGDNTTITTFDGEGGDGVCDPSQRATDPQGFLNDPDCKPNGCDPIAEEVNGSLLIVGRDCGGNGNNVAPRICTDKNGTVLVNDGLAKCCSSNSECGGKNRCLPNSGYLECK